MGDIFFNFFVLSFIAFVVTYERLFGIRGRSILTRILIWLAVLFCYFVIISLPLALWVIVSTIHVSKGFFYDMHRLTGVTPDAPFCAFPEGDFFRSHFLMALAVASIVCGIPAAILLARKGRVHFAKRLLIFCLIFNLVCVTVGTEAYNYADAMTRARHYYLACRAEIERIDALDLDEAEHKAFYKEELRKMGWAKEGIFDRMEGFLTSLKAYPPAPKDAPKE